MYRSKDHLIAGDRRLRRRKHVHSRAWADPGGTAAPIDCLVVDRSEMGAKLVELSGHPLPETFEIRFERHLTPLKAKIIWRYGEMVGVAFQSTDCS